MRSVTGLELGADTCVLVRVHPGHEPPRVSAVDTLPPAGADFDNELRVARRTRHFPKHLRAVVWGLHQSASATDAATRALLGPFRRAGFVIDDVLSPPNALAALARQRSRAPGRAATAWVALNRQAAAFAIVDSGELLFSREFDWHYRPATTAREELLLRYSLVAHLAPELQHAIAVVRAHHRAEVDGIVLCGDLPELRSLTMPLIEELDIEVEALDSLDGLTVGRPARAEDVADKAPALRLACAAAIGEVHTHERPVPRVVAAAAAVLLLVALGWGLMRWTSGGSPGPAPVPQAPVAVALEPPRARPAARDQAPPAGSTVERAAPPTAPLVRERRRDSPAPPGGSLPAATTGQQEGEAAPPAPPAQRVVPLGAPLPAVNSILVSPDRRLAVLDGVILREGDRVGPRVLIRIEPRAVVLREPSGYEIRVPIRRRLGDGLDGRSGQ
jgi:hypothetical protein